MPYMIKKEGDNKYCVHRQNADGTAGESLHCYTGSDAEEKCKDYMKALYAHSSDMPVHLSGDSLDQKAAAVREGFAKTFEPSYSAPVTESYCYIREIYDEYVIVGANSGKLFKVPYTKTNDGITFEPRDKWQAVKIDYVDMAIAHQMQKVLRFLGLQNPADEDKGQWITVNGKHILLDENGKEKSSESAKEPSKTKLKNANIVDTNFKVKDKYAQGSITIETDSVDLTEDDVLNYLNSNQDGFTEAVGGKAGAAMAGNISKISVSNLETGKDYVSADVRVDFETPLSEMDPNDAEATYIYQRSDIFNPSANFSSAKQKIHKLFKFLGLDLAESYGGTARDELKDSDFVFSDERAFPIKTAQDVEDAVSSWGRYKGKHSFDDFKKELTSLAKRKGFESSLPAEWSQEKNMQAFSFTELTEPVSAKFIDGLAANDDDPYIAMSGAEVYIKSDELASYIENTQAIIASTKTESGEIVGLPIDLESHNHKGGAGWIVGLELDKTRNVIRFLVNWTEKGFELIKANLARFFSPSVDTEEKIILGGSLTNWPATRNAKGQILLRPVELSQSIKEIDMEKTLLELLAELPGKVAEAMHGKPPELPNTQLPPTELETEISPELKELLRTPEGIEELGKKAQELARAAIHLEKRKMHTVQFASKLAGGTAEHPVGLKVRPNEVVALLLSLPEPQALAVEKILANALDGAINFSMRGLDGSGFIQKPELPKEFKPYLETWVKAGKSVDEFFKVNLELGNPEDYNLAEFTRKES